MNRSAILSGAVALPTELIDVRKVKNRLTIELLEDDGSTSSMHAYVERRGYLCVPRQFGISHANKLGITIEDRTAQGQLAQWPRIPIPRDYQHEFIDDLVSAASEFYDFLARAHTGFGKTISSLIAAARIGHTTLILVDQENLRDQWLEALEKHFGMTVANGLVGIVQGKNADYEGRTVAIAMVQTLTSRRMPTEFYNWAHTLIVDEVHTIGAPTYSMLLLRINATVRWGVSATTKRKGPTQKLLDYNLNKVQVAADKEHDQSVVYFAQHKTVYSWYANVSTKIGRIITEVAEDGSRNLLIAQATQWLYETGRDTIVLSDRIEQLKHLMSLLCYMGVDPEVMGLYTGNNPQYKYAKEPNPTHMPVGLEPGAEYTPVSLQLIAKTIPKKKLLQVKEEAEIQLCTFGMAQKGYDVPRLTAGVDASPRASSEQAHGRTLREQENMPKPIWVTIEDTGSYRLVRSFALRMQDYAKSNILAYHWHENGELEQWEIEEITRDRMARVKQLQLARIETSRDGRNMLKMPDSVKRQRNQAVIDTVKSIHSRRRN